MEPIIKLKTNLVKKYFKEHPECKKAYDELMRVEYGLWNDKDFTMPFLAARKKRGDG